MQFAVSTLINLNNPLMETSGELVNFVIAHLTLSALIFIPLALTLYLHKNTNQMSIPDFKRRFGFYYLGMHPSSRSLPLPLTSFYRQLLIAFVIVFLGQTPTIQVILLLILNLITTSVLFATKPFLHPGDYYLAQLNEGILMVQTYFMSSIILSDLETVQKNLGWATIFMLHSMFAINFGFEFIVSAKRLSKKFIRKNFNYNNARKKIR